MDHSFVIGDIHGCFDEMLQLIQVAKSHNSKIKIFSVGDLINKGPHSLKVLDYVKSNKIKFVLGNHELKFIRYINNQASSSPQIQKLKEEMAKDLDTWLAWLTNQPYFIEQEDFLVVHAGLQPQTAAQNTQPRILTNIRTWDGFGDDINNSSDPPWHKLYKENKLVIYGHWALQGLCLKDNSIGLDTGCVYGKKLSGVLLPSRKIIQIDAQLDYFSTSNDSIKRN